MKTRSMTRAENAKLLALCKQTQKMSAHPTPYTDRTTRSTKANTHYLRNRRSTVNYEEPDFVYADDKKDTDYAPFVFQRLVGSFKKHEIHSAPITSEPIRFQIIKPSDEIIHSLFSRKELYSHTSVSNINDMFIFMYKNKHYA
jgi:hypothetical protein